VPAGEVGEQPRRFGERDAVAVPARGVPERPGDVGLPYADRAVQDDGLTGVE
jgi:hypothetical protein